MAAKTPQTFANHAKLVPMYHYLLASILLANIVRALLGLTGGLTADTVFDVLIAFALLGTALFARVFALGAQDRVIRLEERLRMQALLPDDLKPRIEDLDIDQICALRFASDAELPDLARKVLDDGISDRKAIKQMIQTWRPDYQRL